MPKKYHIWTNSRKMSPKDIKSGYYSIGSYTTKKKAETKASKWRKDFGGSFKVSVNQPKRKKRKKSRKKRKSSY